METDRSILFAGMADSHLVRYWTARPVACKDGIALYEGDRQLQLSASGAGGCIGWLETKEELRLQGHYRICCGSEQITVVPYEIFDGKYFADRYHYDGDDLGACIRENGTDFALWAPTASAVTLQLYADGHTPSKKAEIPMVLSGQGVWRCSAPCGHGTYYTYAVTTCLGTQEATDPYANAAGLNGQRSMVVDLSRTDPAGWQEELFSSGLRSYSDAILWEIHVRDFSNRITSARYKGKYLAFTEEGLTNEHGQSVGIDYLKKLGITHVHLMPVFDYATVDEADPDSGFNWGYDPHSYNVPEGGYATDPYNGEVRIREFKEMVMALHRAGIGVVTDMVYNHTYDRNNAFNRIVPYYYYRFTGPGINTCASGCGNDTASERYMFRRFMVRSAAYWMEQYHLDGLRFDLMGLHDLCTMQQIEQAVHAIDPQAILYGEGWDMGATMDGSPRATQGNIGKIRPSGGAIGAIAVFNDAMRDGLKGNLSPTARGYINGAPETSLSDVLFGIRGGQGEMRSWSVPDAMVVNYMSAHDNHTLWDKLQLSAPGSTEEARCRMNRLGAALIMISKGTPFWQAGEEMLRTKHGDENSYRSADSINNLDWSVLQEGSAAMQTMRYYSGLIRLRKAFPIFKDPTTRISRIDTASDGVTALFFENAAGTQALAVINPADTAHTYQLCGSWTLIADGKEAGDRALRTEQGSVLLDGISIRIYIGA